LSVVVREITEYQPYVEAHIINGLRLSATSYTQYGPTCTFTIIVLEVHETV